jgi:predicted DNA-binding WGR domain protein
MPDECSLIKHHRVLHRIDPEQGVRRFYSLMIERDMFGNVCLVCNWGQIGTFGHEMVTEFHERGRGNGGFGDGSTGQEAERLLGSAMSRTRLATCQKESAPSSQGALQEPARGQQCVGDNVAGR